MKDKTFKIKLSHLIIGGILLLLTIFLLKCNFTPTFINTYDKEKKEIIVDLVYNRINRIVTKFEELLFQFNVLYKKRIIISLDSFGYNEKLDYLLTLEETKEQNLDMDSID